MSVLERLETLLARVQTNRDLLQRARANGTYGREFVATGTVAQGELNPNVAIASPEPVQAEPEREQRGLLVLQPEDDEAPFADASSGESGELLAAEPEVLDEAELEAELAAQETAGAWQEPLRNDTLAEDGQSEQPATPRTPPPESGPQVSPPAKAVLPEFDDQRTTSFDRSEPRAEQLGATVELEPATAGSLEMATPAPDVPPQPDDDYEESLPPVDHGGVYDESLTPPPTAADELAAMDRAQRERALRLSAVPEVAMSLPPDTIAVPPPSHTSEFETGILARSPVPATVVAATFDGKRRASSHTFLELLDDSLSLGAK